MGRVLLASGLARADGAELAASGREQVEPCAERFPARLDRVALEGTPYGEAQLLFVNRFGEVVAGAEAQRLEDELLVGVRR